MSRGGPEFRSLPERLFGAALLLLLTIIAIRVALHLLGEVLVALLALTAAAVAGAGIFHVWRNRRGGW